MSIGLRRHAVWLQVEAQAGFLAAAFRLSPCQPKLYGRWMTKAPKGAAIQAKATMTLTP